MSTIALQLLARERKLAEAQRDAHQSEAAHYNGLRHGEQTKADLAVARIVEIDAEIATLEAAQ